jgi:hypothetical protein
MSSFFFQRRKSIKNKIKMANRTRIPITKSAICKELHEGGLVMAPSKERKKGKKEG